MTYTKEQIAKAKKTITERLAIGDSLKSILDNDKTLPSRPIVYEWLNEENKKFDKEFLNNYARSRQESADLDADKIEEIVDKTLKGIYDPSSARVAIDALKWTAGKKRPTKYGEKIEFKGDITVNPFLQLMQVATSEEKQ